MADKVLNTVFEDFDAVGVRKKNTRGRAQSVMNFKQQSTLKKNEEILK